MQLTVHDLELGLLAAFPVEDAASWDRTGLLVGDPDAPITRVAVALDPTVTNIRRASEAHCNVLVTHHPAFLDAPDLFYPGMSPLAASGANVYTAISSGVALMNFHTALDFNPRGYGEMPRILGLSISSLLEELGGSTGRNGYGAICDVGDRTTLADLAQRCRDAFGSPVRVWGDPSSLVKSAVTAQGSASSVAAACLEHGIGCLICGEMKYHVALDLSKAGVGIIELGHDISEDPFVGILKDEIVALGVSQTDIECMQASNWTVV